MGADSAVIWPVAAGRVVLARDRPGLGWRLAEELAEVLAVGWWSGLLLAGGFSGAGRGLAALTMGWQEFWLQLISRSLKLWSLSPGRKLYPT